MNISVNKIRKIEKKTGNNFTFYTSLYEYSPASTNMFIYSNNFNLHYLLSSRIIFHLLNKN
jgi:hypothetical protein